MPEPLGLRLTSLARGLVVSYTRVETDEAESILAQMKEVHNQPLENIGYHWLRLGTGDARVQRNKRGP